MTGQDVAPLSPVAIRLYQRAGFGLFGCVLAALIGLLVHANQIVRPWSPIDESGHFAFVESIATEARLPVLGHDLISEKALGVYERLGWRPEPPHLAAYSHEAFQPPLYYVLSAPAYYCSANYTTQIHCVRSMGLLFVAVALWFTWLLVRRLFEAPWRGWAMAMVGSLLLMPGVVFRNATVANGVLELPMLSACLFVMFGQRGRHSNSRIYLAGMLVGLALLTKITLIVLVPVLIAYLFVQTRLRGEAAKRAWRPALVALALPVVLCFPWVVFNFAHYGSATASTMAQQMQRATIEGYIGTTRFDLARIIADARQILNGLVDIELLDMPWLMSLQQPLQWIVVGIPMLLALRLVAMRAPRMVEVAVFGLLPIAGVLMLAVVEFLAQWPMFYPRYLYSHLPAWGIFVAAVALANSYRWLVGLSLASVALVASTWAIGLRFLAH